MASPSVLRAGRGVGAVSVAVPTGYIIGREALAVFWCKLVAVILLSCVFLVLVWVIVFASSQRLLFGQIIFPQRPQHNSPFLGFFNYFEINCPENVRNHAQSYLLRVVALTNATEFGDGYLLNVGTNTFHVRDRYVRHIRGVKDGKSRYEETCFFVPNQGLPSAEQIATALLMLKNDPTLFDKWAVKDGESFKADGRIF
jgi:hypothetical protein